MLVVGKMMVVHLARRHVREIRTDSFRGSYPNLSVSADCFGGIFGLHSRFLIDVITDFRESR